jgi:hypothetical protein
MQHLLGVYMESFIEVINFLFRDIRVIRSTYKIGVRGAY